MNAENLKDEIAQLFRHAGENAGARALAQIIFDFEAQKLAQKTIEIAPADDEKNES